MVNIPLQTGRHHNFSSAREWAVLKVFKSKECTLCDYLEYIQNKNNVKFPIKKINENEEKKI